MDNHLAPVIDTIRDLIAPLSAGDKEKVLVALNIIRPSRASDAHLAICKLFDRKPSWSVHEIRAALQRTDPTVTTKQIYNVLGYLTRHARLIRLGYGRYRKAGVANG